MMKGDKCQMYLSISKFFMSNFEENNYSACDDSVIKEQFGERK